MAPHRRLSNEAIVWWSLVAVSVALAIVCIVVLMGVQPSGLTEFACGLGDRNSCDQLQQVAMLRGIALLGLIGTILVGTVFTILGLIATLRS